MGKNNATSRKLDLPDNVLRLHKAKLTADVVIRAIRCIQWIAVAFFMYRTADTIAGKTTVLVAVWNILAKINVDAKISWAITFTASVGWAFERMARKAVIKRHSKAIGDKEKQSWPERTSSSLKQTGDSPPT